VDELDDVADDAHDEKADADCLGDLDELALVWLGAAVDELQAVLDELLRHTVEQCQRVRRQGMRAAYSASSLTWSMVA
jgi:hypothetical protein